MPREAANVACIKQRCILSHRLVDSGEVNFGGGGKDDVGGKTAASSSSTAVFSNMCRECLLVKFGLVESYHRDDVARINPSRPASLGDRLEGPYLRATRPVASASASASASSKEVVFEPGTIILACGQLLTDVFMSEERSLFANSKDAPVVNLKDTDMQYRINPYTYLYFKRLRGSCIKRSKGGDRTASGEQMSFDTFEDVLLRVPTRILSGRNEDALLCAAYEVDVLSASNLINPSAECSVYVSEGKTTTLRADKVLIAELIVPAEARVDDDAAADEPGGGRGDEAENPEPVDSAEDASCRYVKLQYGQSFDLDVCIDKTKIQRFNGLLFSHLNSTRRAIADRRKYLLRYFASKERGFASAAERVSYWNELSEAKKEHDRRQYVESSSAIVRDIAGYELQLKRLNPEWDPRSEDVLEGLVQNAELDLSVARDDVARSREALIRLEKKGARRSRIGRASNLRSCASLHLASFCVPGEIIRDDVDGESETTVRDLPENVEWIEGLGLVSTSEICHEELLVIGQKVSLRNFVALKMSGDPCKTSYFEPSADLVASLERAERTASEWGGGGWEANAGGHTTASLKTCIYEGF